MRENVQGRWLRGGLVAAGVALIAVVATACGEDGNSTAQQSVSSGSIQGTIGASSFPDQSSRPATTSVQQAPASHVECSTIGQAEIERGISLIAPPFPGGSPNADTPWAPRPYQANYNTCAALSYAEITIDHASAASPEQLLLFHHGKFVGTGIKCNTAFQSVTNATDDTVFVTYRYLTPGDPNAAPQGEAFVSFYWDGASVVMNGTLPTEVTRGLC
ncbi:LppP/LprE family lipoprotein [Gordonia amicalis]|uniref:LppP/LprE family lipoprotein n=1 Tax=Gordonia amicalis TaxID=89053 RepID=UPI0022B30D5E|nr:LppP/LprE family lipoprotein [Gordonia amicalis]MCZ4581531.1 LppP/LprE family lipoprotein [Gordonia amicalis]